MREDVNRYIDGSPSCLGWGCSPGKQWLTLATIQHNTIGFSSVNEGRCTLDQEDKVGNVCRILAGRNDRVRHLSADDGRDFSPFINRLGSEPSRRGRVVVHRV